MARILVFQHVPYEPLGTLDPLIRARRHRIRYVNFGRDPQAQPSLDGYQGLVVLGGPMNVDQQAQYPHLAVEIACLREALRRDLPVLGICLGAQLLAAAGGAEVRPAGLTEIGWHPVAAASAASDDALFQHWRASEMVFQWHGYTFDLPPEATLLATGEHCQNQAFRLGTRAWGLQFHLEVNAPLARRWVKLPAHQPELANWGPEGGAARIREDSDHYLGRSEELSMQVFGGFLQEIGQVRQRVLLSSR